MKILKNKKFIISISSLFAILLIACLSYGIVASWLTKETLQSSVEISLLLQGDEADIYESPVNLTSKGTYELSIIGTKDTDGTYVGNDVDEGKMPEPSRKNYYDYVMPGVNIPKDPKVFITKKSGAPAYLYIEVFEHNFPEYFTEEGFEELGVNDPVQNPNEVNPIYYYLEDYWTPVYTAEGKQAVGVNGGALYVYYNTKEYFETNKYNQKFTIEIGAGSDKEKINQGATYLSSYIMKDESTGPNKIDKQKYYGTNEVKTVDGQPMDCPYFNILKEDTVYVSEKYIHPEYYSKLYSGLAEKTGKVTKEGHDFGLYFFSYMTSAKIDGAYASPFDAYTKAGFMEEEAYLMYLYESTDNNPENIPQDRILYVWAEHTYMDNGKERLGLQEAVDNYFGDNQPYKIVLMDSFEVESTITVPVANFVLDMNGKTVSVPSTASFGQEDAVWYQTYESNTKMSNVTIRGNGTFYMKGNSEMLDRTDMFRAYGRLTIEDGSYIREYNPNKSQSLSFGGQMFHPMASKQSVVIKGGYFDNGYLDLSGEITSSNVIRNYNPKVLLPVYDNVSGKGWLMFSDNSYLTIDSTGRVWKRKMDDLGNLVYEQKVSSDGRPIYMYHPDKEILYKDDVGFYFENDDTTRSYITTEDGTTYSFNKNGTLITFTREIYPVREVLDFVEDITDTKVYVRKQDEEGKYTIGNHGNYELEVLDSYTIVEEDGKYMLKASNPNIQIYGPDPRGIGTVIGISYSPNNPRITVYGGTFVGYNPAWGDELGLQQVYVETRLEVLDDSKYNPQVYFNPYFGLYSTNGQGTFLDGQVIWQDESIPDDYNITESSTQYTYEDENGEIKSFYVPVYTVNYKGEIPD